MSLSQLEPASLKLSLDSPRVAVVCDLVEDNWPSMDLVAEMLLEHLRRDHASAIRASRLCPRFVRRLGRIPLIRNKWAAYTVDRLCNRFRDYPRWLQRHRQEYDLFHIVDHSYAHLANQLPAGRTIVTCHDLDAFACLWQRNRRPRSQILQAIARHVLRGLQRAALVTCDSYATRDQLLTHALLPPYRVTVVHNGVHPACSPNPNQAADEEIARRLGPSCGVEILHVGSTIPRKRIDALLRVFSSVRRDFPKAVLVRVGGPFTPPQMELISQLKLRESIVVLPFLERKLLAAVYRRAAVVLQPSEAEGFGLPVIEAMACGTPVVASDLPVLREIGGEAAVYRPVGDVAAWSKVVTELISERNSDPDRWLCRQSAGIAQGAKFRWAEYARRMVGLYSEVWASATVRAAC